MLLADVKEVLGRVKWGGVRIGERSCYTLGYADNMIIMVEEEDEMRSMFEEYVDGKRLEITGKTKIMRFKKGGGRMRRRDWR